jgi:L-malate glycosyltransferase
MPAHVLIIPSFYPTLETPLDGIFFKEQARMLKDAGVHIGVIYPEIRPLKKICPKLLLKNHFQCSFCLEESIPTYRLHGWNLSPSVLKGTMLLWIAAVRILFDKYVRTEGFPDLIHAHCSIWAGIAARKISEKYKLPFIITEHRDLFLHSTPFSEKWLLKELYKTFESSKQNVAVSNRLQQGLHRALSLSSPIQVIPNFVDHTYFHNLAERAPIKPFTFLTVAHLVKNKNIEGLLHAFRLLMNHHPEAKLKIVGEGPEKKYLKELALNLNITSNVEFLGAQQRPALKNSYASSHSFILSSFYETFGTVFIEALSMGIPIIGTRSGGPEDIIIPEVGLLVSKNDPLMLMHAMLSVKKNYMQYQPESLRNYVVEKFGKESISALYKNLYDSFYSA